MTQEHVINPDDVQELLRLSQAYAEACDEAAAAHADLEALQERLPKAGTRYQDTYLLEREAARKLEAFAVRLGYPLPEVQGGGVQ